MKKRPLWERLLRFSGVIVLVWLLSLAMPGIFWDELNTRFTGAAAKVALWKPVGGVLLCALLYYLFVIWNSALDLKNIVSAYLRVLLGLEFTLLILLAAARYPIWLVLLAMSVVILATIFQLEVSNDQDLEAMRPFVIFERGGGHLIIPLFLAVIITYAIPGLSLSLVSLLKPVLGLEPISQGIGILAVVTLWLTNLSKPIWAWVLLVVSYAVELLLCLTASIWATNLGWWVLLTVLVCITTAVMLLLLTRVRPTVPRPVVRYVSDEPERSLDNDRLGRKELVHQLVAAVGGAPSPAAFVIGIFGGWGTGKSTLMYMAKKEAETAGHKTLWLNAWMYDDKAAIWKAFVNGMIKLMREYRLPVMPFAPVRKYYRLADALLKGVAPSGLSVFGSSLSSVMEHLPSTEEFEAAKEAVSRQVEALVGVDRRLVVFIDDLDRCSPKGVLGTLEFLKEIADLKHCVFVLGVDDTAVRAVLEKHYEGKGAEFLHKVIHLPFEIPVPHGNSLYELLPPGFRVEAAAAQSVIELFRPFVQGNPRNLKRVMNRAAQLQNSVEVVLGQVPVHSLLAAELLWANFPKVHTRLRDPEICDQLLDLYQDIMVSHYTANLPGDLTAVEGWRYSLARLLDLEPQQAPGVSDLLAALVRHLHPKGRASLWTLFGQTDPPEVVSARQDIAEFVRRLEQTRDTQAAADFLFSGGLSLVPRRIAGVVAEKNRLLRMGEPPEGSRQNRLLREYVLSILNHPDRRKVEAVTSIIDAATLRQFLACEFRYGVGGLASLISAVADKHVRITVQYEAFSPTGSGASWPRIPPELSGEWMRQRRGVSRQLWDEFIMALGRAPLTELLAARPIYQDAVWHRTEFPPVGARASLERSFHHGDREVILHNIGQLFDRWLEGDPRSGDGARIWPRLVESRKTGLLRAIAGSLDGEESQREQHLKRKLESLDRKLGVSAGESAGQPG